MGTESRRAGELADPSAVRESGSDRIAVGGLLRRALTLYNSLWTEVVGSDPTSAQFSILNVLARRPGIDQRSAGELSSLDKSSTMEIVRRLDLGSWLTRSKDPADARRYVLTLTRPAALLMEHLMPKVQEVHAQLLAPLDAQQRQRFLALTQEIGQGETDKGNARPEGAGMLIRRARQVHDAYFGEALGELLTAPQFAILNTIHERSGSSHWEVRSIVGTDRSTTTDIVERLVRRGWIDRTRDPNGTNRWLLTLTSEGRATHDDLLPRAEHVQARLLQPLSIQERPQLIALLRLVVRSEPQLLPSQYRA